MSSQRNGSKDVVVVIGPGQIGQAIARRVGAGKHVVRDRSRWCAVHWQCRRQFEERGDHSLHIAATWVPSTVDGRPAVVPQVPGRRSK
jgi:threonine dehydrogenase-like Zn-dependent dehydrogenase